MSKDTQIQDRHELVADEVGRIISIVHLGERALAHRWGISVKTLRNKRVTGGFIPYVKISRNVRYRLSDIVAWEEANLHCSTSEEARNE